MKATSFGRKQRARNGEAAASNVSFAAYANGMPATQAMAPYLGRTVEQERKSQADVVSRMVGNGSHMAAEEITRVLDFTGVTIRATASTWRPRPRTTSAMRCPQESLRAQAASRMAETRTSTR